MKNKTLRILIAVLVMAALTFSGLCLFFILAFLCEFSYILLLFIVYIFLMVMIPGLILRPGRTRRRVLVVRSLLLLVILTVMVRESVRLYHGSFETIDENKVDLGHYAPFEDNTLAASLDTVSALILTDSLPALDGATVIYPVYASFARAVYKPEYNPQPWVQCLSTRWAYYNLLRDDADIIFVFHPSEKQLADARCSGVELEITPVGREAFVFFVNARNPVSGLSTDRLRDIYLGRITNWDRAGGPKKKIKAFQHDKGSGSQTALADFMGEDRLMPAPEKEKIYRNPPIIDRAAIYANYAGAIGFGFRYFVENMVGSDGIKILSVDGVYPSIETIADGSYPLVFEFYAVTRADRTNPNIDRLLEWIRSPQEQELVARSGYIPAE